MTSFEREVKPWVLCLRLRHIKEAQAEIRASGQNLSDFSRYMSEVMLMMLDVKEHRKTQLLQQQHPLTVFSTKKKKETICNDTAQTQ